MQLYFTLSQTSRIKSHCIVKTDMPRCPHIIQQTHSPKSCDLSLSRRCRCFPASLLAVPSIRMSAHHHSLIWYTIFLMSDELHSIKTRLLYSNYMLVHSCFLTKLIKKIFKYIYYSCCVYQEAKAGFLLQTKKIATQFFCLFVCSTCSHSFFSSTFYTQYPIMTKWNKMLKCIKNHNITCR